MDHLITDPVWIQRILAAKILHPEIVHTHIQGERLHNPLPTLFRSEPEGLFPRRGTLLRLDEQRLPIGDSILYILLLDEGLIGMEVEIPVGHPAEIHLTHWEDRVLTKLLETLDLHSLNVPHVAIVCLEGDKDAYLAPTAQVAVNYLRERSISWESSVHQGLDRSTATIQELSEIYADGRDLENTWVDIAILPQADFPLPWKGWLTLYQKLQGLVNALEGLRSIARRSVGNLTDQESFLKALDLAEASIRALLHGSESITVEKKEQGDANAQGAGTAGKARSLIGVQTGLLQARDALTNIQQSIPSVVQLLDEQFQLLQILAAINPESTQKNPQTARTQVIEIIGLLCEAVRGWIAFADGGE